LLLLLVVVLAQLLAGDLQAQPTGQDRVLAQDRILAQALFDDARQLMTDRHYAEACVKFAESNRLDPGIGTQFNLADCYEMTGQLSGAWILFVDVAAAARSAHQPQRAAVAQRRALALEPRLTRIRIDVQSPVDGLVVRRNGESVSEPQWGTAVPVVPGRYRIEAHALGHYSWRKMVEVRGKGVTLSVVIPELASDDEPNGGGDDSGPMSVRHLAAAIMGGCGVVGLGVGLGAGLVALDKTGEAEDHCPEPDACYDAGLALRDEARDAAAVSTVGFVVGGGALVGALVLWLTAPEQGGSPAEPASDEVAWWLLPAVGTGGQLGAATTLGLSFGGRW
jgi:hypothetical protein